MKSDNTQYLGTRNIDRTVSVYVDGEVLDPSRSQKVRNHSPDGFEYGYGGSGPAQLALAILLDFLNDEEVASQYYQKFKFAFISRFPQEKPWTITGFTIREWFENEHKIVN